jgi:hypothetical protein
MLDAEIYHQGIIFDSGNRNIQPKMSKKKYQFFAAIIFLSVFCAKMLISAAPVFLQKVDKELVNSVIMQVELEHGSDSETGKTIKYVDFKIINHTYHSYMPVVYDFMLTNSFLNHSKRYVNPYHPSVPTPPPNFS